MTVAELVEHLRKLEHQDWPVYYYTSDGWDDRFWTKIEEFYQNNSMERYEVE